MQLPSSLLLVEIRIQRRHRLGKIWKFNSQINLKYCIGWGWCTTILNHSVPKDIIPISQLYTTLSILYIDRQGIRIFLWGRWMVNYIFSVNLSKPVKKVAHVRKYGSAVQFRFSNSKLKIDVSLFCFLMIYRWSIYYCSFSEIIT